MNGWEREIIEPFQQLVKPYRLVWKEKFGTLRAEWLHIPGLENTMKDPGPMGRVLEEASRLCCMECGRWHGWLQNHDKEAAVVENKPVRGWYLTLCQWCRKTAEAEK